MNKVIIASGPVIVKNNKVLLNISGEDDFWKFCGGKIKEDLNLKETAKFRAKEELGIKIILKNKEAFIISLPKPGEENKDVVLVHYLADYSGKIIPGEMVKEWDWLDIDNLPDNLAPNIIPTLKFFGFLK